MGQFLEKFIERLKRQNLIKCILIALSAGLFVTGVALIPCALTNRYLPVWAYIVMAIVAMGGGFAISYEAFPRSRQALTKELDKRLHLQERSQTSYAYQNEQGDIYDLQREDTEKALSKTPLSAVRFSRSGVYLVCGILSVVVFVTGVVLAAVMPARFKAEEEKNNPVIVITDDDWEWKKLDEIIRTVESSQADKGERDDFVKELTDFRNLLASGTVRENQLTTFAKEVVQSIQNIATRYIETLTTDQTEELKKSDPSAYAQRVINIEVRDYVVDNLCEMFKLDNDKSQTEDTPDKEKKEDDAGESGGSGTGTTTFGSNETFFDPEQGYVQYGDVIADYYEIAQAMMNENETLSNEWSDAVLQYFMQLYGTGEDQN